MNRIRQAVTSLCLATTLAASAPCLAESRGAPQGADPGGAPRVQEASGSDLSRMDFSRLELSRTDLPRLNLPRLQRMATWSDPSMASPQAPLPLKAHRQANGGGWAGMSTAKKTWIIVGSVLGAAVVVAAVSNHGGGGGGGGGY